MTSREHPSFTLGMEEEYFLVNPWAHALVSEPPRQPLDDSVLIDMEWMFDWPTMSRMALSATGASARLYCCADEASVQVAGSWRTAVRSAARDEPKTTFARA